MSVTLSSHLQNKKYFLVYAHASSQLAKALSKGAFNSFVVSICHLCHTIISLCQRFKVCKYLQVNQSE